MTAVTNPKTSETTQSELLRGSVASLPLIIGFLPFAIVLGAQAVQKGLSAFEISLMSAMSFAGGADMATIQIWTWPPQILLIALITFLINSRYILMSASITPYIQHLPKRTTLPMLFLLCDVVWVMSVADSNRREREGRKIGFSTPYFIGSGLTFYFSWVAFTLCGASLGPLLGNLKDYGFDMTIPAVFLVMLRGIWKGWKKARPWLVSLIAAVLTYKFIPGPWYVITGTGCGLISAYWWAETP